MGEPDEDVEAHLMSEDDLDEDQLPAFTGALGGKGDQPPSIADDEGQDPRFAV